MIDGHTVTVAYAESAPQPASGAAAAAIQAAMAMSAAAQIQGSAYGEAGARAKPASSLVAVPTLDVAPSSVISASGMLEGVPETLVYDSSSGYYYDSATGYYYDSATGWV